MARLAVSPEFTVVTDEYYSIDTKTASSDLAQDAEKQDELVKLSRELLEAKGFKI
jgi:hypothetical protein